jgi:transposase-like protein
MLALNANYSHTVKNGRIHNGKQCFKCKACGRQFIERPTQKRVTPEQIALIDRLLLERISQAAIARVAQVSKPGLNPMWQSKPVALLARRKCAQKKTVQSCN